MLHPRALILVPFLSASLAGCGQAPEAPEVIRPVRAIELVAAPATLTADFSGEVRPRIESRLGFRVAGKILARKVDVGQVVKPGQVLASLDPQDLQLAQASARAQMSAAETDLKVAQSDFKRYSDLAARNFIGSAELERRQNTLVSAQARYDQAASSLKIQGNQAAYANLIADTAGVVTAIDAEVGQVVTAGQSVIRVAQTAEKEVVFAVPEDKVALLAPETEISVKVWSRPDQPFPGKIREISPSADPATRTYTAKASIPAAPAFVLLGMTATATLKSASAQMALRLPLSALVNDKGANAVWVIDPAAMTVKLTPVQLAGPVGNELLVASGLAPGQKVVTAGVNLLKPDQRVRILAADAAQ